MSRDISPLDVRCDAARAKWLTILALLLQLGGALLVAWNVSDGEWRAVGAYISLGVLLGAVFALPRWYWPLQIMMWLVFIMLAAIT